MNQSEEDVDKQHWDAVDEGVELVHEQRFAEALIFFRALLETERQNPYAYFFSGVALFEMGKLEPSRDAYEACLKLAPDHLGAKVALSHVHRSLGDPKSAIVSGMAALSQAPEDADALHAVGLAYLEKGDSVAARKYLEAFLRAGPEFEVATEVRSILESLKENAEIN